MERNLNCAQLEKNEQISQESSSTAHENTNQSIKSKCNHKIYIPQPQNKLSTKNNINNDNKLQISDQNQSGNNQFEFFKALLLLSSFNNDNNNNCNNNYNNKQPKETQKKQENKENQVKKHHCNCKKSKCLKLYCECFVNGEECDSQCNCMDCQNNSLYSAERAKARQNITMRDSLKNNLNIQLNSKRGCNCKKSGCLKKYCECYNAGVPCTEYCKCEGCQNCGINKKVQLNCDLTHSINDNLKFSIRKQNVNNNSSKINNSNSNKENLIKFSISPIEI